MKLSVPYYSQFVDIQDPYWMLRACGMMSLWEVLAYHKKLPVAFDGGAFIAACNEAKSQGGYHLENGWVHDYLVSYAIGSGCAQSYRTEGLTYTDKIRSLLDEGAPVIISVTKRVLEQTRFHMIVIVGYEAQGEAYVYYYHDTESTDKARGQYRTCTEDQLIASWRGKMIVVK